MEFVVWAEVNLAVVLPIRDHHGHPDYLADGINGDRLEVYVWQCKAFLGTLHE